MKTKAEGKIIITCLDGESLMKNITEVLWKHWALDSDYKPMYGNSFSNK